MIIINVPIYCDAVVLGLNIYKNLNIQNCGASDSVTDSSVLSNPTDAQNVFCLGLCSRDIYPKSSA